MVPTLAPLWLPGFRRLLGAYALAELAWGLSSVALTVLVYHRTGNSVGPTALFLAAMTVPAFAAPGLAARLESFPARWAMAWLYVAQAATFALLAVISGRSPVWVVLVLAFVDGAAGLASRALARGSTAALLEPRDLLREGNALMNIVFGVLYMLAPALGGLTVAELGGRTALALTAACFALMAVVLATAPDLSGAPIEHEPWWRRTRAAIAHVRERPVARRLLGGQAVAIVFFTLIVPIEVVYVARNLHEGASAYGGLLSAWGAGSLAGGLLYARLRRGDLSRLISVGTVLVGAGYLAMACAPDVATSAAGAAVGGLGNGMQFVAVVTSLQEAIGREYQSRVMALLEAVGSGIPGIGFVLGGAITAIADPRVTFAVAGAGAMVVGVVLHLRLPRSNAPPADPSPVAPPEHRGWAFRTHAEAAARTASEPLPDGASRDRLCDPRRGRSGGAMASE